MLAVRACRMGRCGYPGWGCAGTIVNGRNNPLRIIPDNSDFGGGQVFRKEVQQVQFGFRINH